MTAVGERVPRKLNRRTALIAMLGTLGITPFPPTSAWALQRRQSGVQLPGKTAVDESTRVLPRLDALMHDILTQHQIAGASLALAHQGRLIVARGYGLADVERRVPARPDTLFCIASVGKAIVSAALLKLVEAGKLRLDDRLAQILADLQLLPGHKVVDPRFREITVRHLLYHAGGWNVRDGGDAETEDVQVQLKQLRAAGIEGPATPELRYRFAMGQPLDFIPGTESHYSNFGFVIARLVAERVAGQPFEPFARQHVLGPMGITRMRMELVEPNYAPDEARRYAPGGRKLLGGGHSRLTTGSENWIASAADLVRFVVSLNGSRRQPFLTHEMFETMLAPPPPPFRSGRGAAHVGLGWDTVERTPGGWRFSKNGGKAGVAAWLEHLPGDVAWSVLFNTGHNKQDGKPPPLKAARTGVYEVVDAIRQWPQVDLFAQ